MVIIKCFSLIIICVLLNKALICIRKYLDNKAIDNCKIKSIPSRKDLINYGIDYYLVLCQYIISNMIQGENIDIQDITGREVVDIKFIENNNIVYASCLLKDVIKNGEFEEVSYDEVLELLNYMIKDNVNKGMIITNSGLDDRAIKFVSELNKNSNSYKIQIVEGYEVIKFARKRNEENIKEFKYA